MADQFSATVVIDASAVVDLLVNGYPLPSPAALASPAHLDAEVLSALGRLHRDGTLSVLDVEQMLEDLAALPVIRVAIEELTVMAFALRHKVALRDGLYVALAQVTNASLKTSDARLARACRDQRLCVLFSPTV